LRHWILNPTCLPIPPPEHIKIKNWKAENRSARARGSNKNCSLWG